jgi:three-Cys-motif partner protein
MKNQFGGDWTEQKIKIVYDYAKAYLQIMKEHPYWKTIYFDGFAGTGEIVKERAGVELKIIEGASRKILSINDPISFDIYYFVELDEQKAKTLGETIKKEYPNKKAFVVAEDCNNKLISMAGFLNNRIKAKDIHKALCFIDPFGMQINWSSLEALKGLGVDLWILVPTGVGANRLLKKNGDISDAWLKKLENFLGISKDEILNKFYKTSINFDLFGEENPIVSKENNAIEKIHTLYKEKLLTVFEFVSEPFRMRNSSNSTMYHFMLATNNSTALKIANDIIKPKYK